MRYVLLLMGLFLVSSCGIQNPYREREKKCKAGCEPKQDSAVPRPSANLSFDPQFWLDVTRPESISEKDVDAILRFVHQNPFSLGTDIGAYQDVARRVAQLKELSQAGQWDESERCLLETFLKPAVRSEHEISLSADYGRCDKLTDYNGPSASPGKTFVFKEYEEAFKLATRFRTGNSLQPDMAVENASQLGKVFPFQTLDMSGSSGESTFQVETYFSTVNINTAAVVEGNQSLGDLRRWLVFSLGLNENKRFSLNANPSSGLVIPQGTILLARGEVLRPKSPTSFHGEVKASLFVEYIFSDFKMKGGKMVLGTQLGFSPDKTLEGHYFVVVNGQLYFKISAQGRPCDVVATQLIPRGESDWDEGSSESFSLCNASRSLHGNHSVQSKKP